MSIGEITSLMRDGITEVLLLIAPPLILALIIGLVVAILQAITSIQEQTLTFLPKLVVILFVIAFLGGFMFSHLGNYTVDLFKLIPKLAS